MKKTLSILFLIIVIMVFTVGCQATPEKEIVIGKDLDSMISKAVTEKDIPKGASLAESLHAPTTYTADFEGYKGELSVHADAKVVIPNAGSVSVMRVNKHSFTQEEADKMVKVFLKGEKLYKVDGSLTKEEIRAKLVTYYGMRDGSIPVNIDGENPKDTDKLKKVIKDYEEMLATAPETKNPTPANTKFHAPETLNTDDHIQVIEGMAAINNKQAYLYIENWIDRNKIEATFINAQNSSKNMNYCPYSVLDDESRNNVKPPETFKMTEKEARSIAEDVLKQLGFTEMTCAETRFAVMSQEVVGGNAQADAGRVKLSPEQLKKGKWAYSLQYQRTINGTPITLTKRSGTSVEEENSVSVSWPFERLELIVDETGVVYFHHLSPYHIQETVTEKASLLDFQEITSVFEKMFPITYGYLNDEGTAEKLQVKITEVRLGLMRVTEQNSRDRGLLIPVWDFFGDVTVISPKGGSHTNTSDSLLTINAVDGAVIDRGLGY